MIYFLQGTESFLFEQELTKIAEKANVSLEDVVYYSASDAAFATCVLETNSDDLFGANKIIVLKDLAEQKISQYLMGIDEQVVNVLQESQNILVIHFWREETLSKTLQQELAPILKQATIVDTKKQKEKAVVQAIAQALSEREHTLSAEDFVKIAQKYQNNLALIHHEIARILLEKQEAEAITLEDFDTDTQFLEEQVFHLIESLENKQVDQVVQLLDNLLLHQQNVFGVLALLLKNYKEMYQMQALADAGYTLQQITTRLNLHPYRAKLLSTKAKGLNEYQYQFILHKIITTEIELKRGAQQAIAIRELFMHILNV